MRPWIRRVSTPQNLNLLGFCQIQKIEQVMPEVTVILQELETFKIFFKNTIYYKKTQNLHATLDSQGVYPSKFEHFWVLPNSKDRASLCGAYRDTPGA